MKQTLITFYFSPIKKNYTSSGYTDNTWRCIECNVDIGSMNPRQLCGKTYCIFNKLFTE